MAGQDLAGAGSCRGWVYGVLEQYRSHVSLGLYRLARHQIKTYELDPGDSFEEQFVRCALQRWLIDC